MMPAPRTAILMLIFSVFLRPGMGLLLVFAADLGRCLAAGAAYLIIFAESIGLQK
jgi:hypothetical protein